MHTFSLEKNFPLTLLRAISSRGGGPTSEMMLARCARPRYFLCSRSLSSPLCPRTTLIQGVQFYSIELRRSVMITH